ncbi:MAG: hypothetical protein ACLTEH_03530 [Clostridia bacterium]
MQSTFYFSTKNVSTYQQEVDNYETQIAEEDTKILTNMKDNVNSQNILKNNKKN